MSHIIANKKLEHLLGATVGVDVESGTVLLAHPDGVKDITNPIMELAMLVVEDQRTFVLLDRKIRITVEAI